MVNEQNDTILLHGVGLGNWLLPECTSYTVFAKEDFNGDLDLELKALKKGSTLRFTINNALTEIPLSDTTWTTVQLENQYFLAGKNTMTAEVVNGEVLLLHFDINEKE